MGAALDDPRRPGGEHHEHSGHPQPALQREGDTLLEKPGESAHHRYQRGSAEGGLRGRLAPGFYLRILRCVGAAPLEY